MALAYHFVEGINLVNFWASDLKVIYVRRNGGHSSVLGVGATCTYWLLNPHWGTVGPRWHNASATLAVFVVPPSSTVAHGGTLLGVLLALLYRFLA